MAYLPVRFISEAVEVHFDRPPLLEKKPGCPDAFTWRGSTYRIVALLSEWHDYQRRGRMSRNMRAARLLGRGAGLLPGQDGGRADF